MSDPRPERRSQQRLPVRVPVSIQARQGRAQASGYTRDLSRSGLFLYTDSRIAAMVLILPPELTAAGEKRWVCCRASVVRVEDSEDGSDFGVAARIRSIEILPEILG